VWIPQRLNRVEALIIRDKEKEYWGEFSWGDPFLA
jgi:hypothetical protein